MLAVLVSVAAAVVGGAIGGNAVDVGGAIFFILPCVWGITLGATLVSRRVLPAMQNESMILRRMVIGLFAGGFALALTLPFFAAAGSSRYSPYHQSVGEIYLCGLARNACHAHPASAGADARC